MHFLIGWYFAHEDLNNERCLIAKIYQSRIQDECDERLEHVAACVWAMKCIESIIITFSH